LGGKTINNIALGELDRHKVEKTGNLRMLNYWVSLVTGKNSKISVALFNTC
jgi:hypothetical protein